MVAHAAAPWVAPWVVGEVGHRDLWEAVLMEHVVLPGCHQLWEEWVSVPIKRTA